MLGFETPALAARPGLALPDGHGALQLVDGVAGSLEGLAAVRCPDGHHHRRGADVDDTRAVEQGDTSDGGPPAAELGQNLAHATHGGLVVGLVLEAMHLRAALRVVTRVAGEDHRGSAVGSSDPMGGLLHRQVRTRESDPIVARSWCKEGGVHLGHCTWPAVLSAGGTTTVSDVAMDDDGDDDVDTGGPPLPPEDRLWRHPSELRQHGASGGLSAPLATARPIRPTTWTVGVVAGLAGAALTTAVIAVTGSLSPRVIEREIVEKVAVTPVVSSPMLRGERGVVAVAERLSPAIVRLDVEQAGGTATGSGVLFRDDGLVLTSAHVVAGATAISVVLTDGRRLDGHLVGLDGVTDVALVDVDGQGFPVAVLGTADGLEVGAPAIAIGSPLGLDGGPSVTTGVISALDRRVDASGGEQLHGMIQTDAPVAPGSSGGALVDANGAVIGIMTAVADQPGGRFGFATPIDLAHRVAQQLLATGHMAHGWLGVEGTDLTAAQAMAMRVAGGARVQRVTASSPAAQAGLTPDDVITEVDGKAIRSTSNLVVQLRAHDPGDQVVVGYWRRGQHTEVTITLVEHP